MNTGQYSLLLLYIMCIWNIFWNNRLQFEVRRNNFHPYGSNEGSEKSSEKNEKSREKVLELISKNPSISANNIAKEIGISSRAVEKHIKNLKADNKIKRIGADKGGYWKIVE